MIGMMDYRFKSLLDSFEGLKRTDIPLVAFDGSRYQIVGRSDDQGIYYFIPQIAKNLSIPIESAITLFYLSWNLTALALGLVGFLLLFKSWPEKLVATLALTLFAIHIFKFGYIYSFQASAIVATIPLFLYFFKNKNSQIYFAIFCIFIGIWLGISNHLRIHSGLGALIFISVLLIFYFRGLWKNKTILLVALFIGYLLPILYTNVLFNERNKFLDSVGNARTNIVYQGIWHSTYIGFGYIKNDFNIQYSDQIAINKVRQKSTSAEYLSQEYNNILKHEVLRLILNHPFFIFKTIVAKFSKIFFLLIAYANLGLWLAIKYPKSPGINLAFTVALIFQSSIGFLVLPTSWYLLGFITFSALFGVVSINEAIQKGYLHNIWDNLFKRRIKT